MTNNDTRIELVTTVTPEHWDLLLSADPSKKLIQNYLQAGMLFARSKDGHPIAVMVLQELTSDKLEIKNIAVDPRLLLYPAGQYSGCQGCAGIGLCKKQGICFKKCHE